MLIIKLSFVKIIEIIHVVKRSRFFNKYTLMMLDIG